MAISKKNNSKNSGWIDVSVPLREGMVVFAFENNMQIERRYSMERGDMGNNSSIHMGVHTGTHMDAPRHVLANGQTIDQMPLISIQPEFLLLFFLLIAI